MVPRFAFFQCAVVRGYKLIKSYIAEGNICVSVTGQMLRHGTHTLGLAGSLEASGPKGSTVAGEREFSIPGSVLVLTVSWLPLAMLSGQGLR